MEQKSGVKKEGRIICAGLSPNTGNKLYTMSKDAPLTMKWQDAVNYTATLNVSGHNDWRLPTKCELNTMFKERAAIGGFDESGCYPDGWYLSSGEDRSKSRVWVQSFSTGQRYMGSKELPSSFRPVRSVPRQASI